ncbi:MAG: peptidylprolyl isomerase [Candidatus Alcyoniella australis]|nr:peptidylprolyl isomerase [Candidatus Alcyoniella australis]
MRKTALALALVCLPLLLASSALAEERGLEKLVTILQAQDARQVTEGLAQLTRDPDPAIAARALRALGRIGDPVALPLLLEALHSGNVRDEAIFALGELEDRETLALIGAKPDPMALEALRGVLVEPTTILSQDVLLRRALAVEALGKLRDREWVEKIVEAGTMGLGGMRGSMPELLCLNAITALVRIDDEAALPLLLSALEAPSPALRRSAALGLGRMGRTETADELSALFNDPDPEVRSAALWALVRLAASDKANLALRMLSDPVLEVRIEAIRLLALGSGPEVSGALFHHLRRSGGRPPAAYNNEDLEVLRALGRLGGKDERNLLSMLVSQPGPAGLTARWAYATCKTVEDRDVLTVERKYYASTPLSYVSWAEALAQRGGEAGRIGLRAVIEDPAAPAEAKCIALDALADKLPEQVEAWATEFLSQPGSPPQLKAGAAQALSAIQSQSALAELLAAWPRAHHEVDPDVRLSLLDALGKHAARLDQRSQRWSRVRAAIYSGTRDQQRLVRAQAIRLMREIYNEDLLSMLAQQMPASDDGRCERAAQLIGKLRILRIETPRGRIDVRLETDDAPLTVLQISELARSGAYNGLIFHRVVPDFVVQGGDPRGTGWGSAGELLPCEISRLRFVTGAVGMATAGKDTGSSQFFFTLSPQPHLDGGYTVFGEVVQGMDVVRRLLPGDKIVRATLLDLRPQQ